MSLPRFEPLALDTNVESLYRFILVTFMIESTNKIDKEIDSNITNNIKLFTLYLTHTNRYMY